MVLGVLLGLFSFISFFLHDILDDDVQHINAFPKLGDVQLALGIFICCFPQKSYYFFRYFPPFLDFQRQLTSFYSTLIHVFERFLRQGFLECLEVCIICQQAFLGCLKAALIRQQASLPISRSGTSFLSIEVIASVTYLGN